MKMHDNHQQKTLSATNQTDSPLWQALSDCEAESIKGGTILYPYIVRFDSPTRKSSSTLLDSQQIEVERNTVGSSYFDYISG
jgi:hypothetical protein